MIIRRCCVCKEEMGVADPTTPEIIEYSDGYCRLDLLKVKEENEQLTEDELVELKSLKTWRRWSVDGLRRTAPRPAHA